MIRAEELAASHGSPAVDLHLFSPQAEGTGGLTIRLRGTAQLESFPQAKGDLPARCGCLADATAVHEIGHVLGFSSLAGVAAGAGVVTQALRQLATSRPFPD